MGRYEGDNFVLDQQVVRAAFKAYRALKNSIPRSSAEALSPSSYYLRLLIAPRPAPPSFHSTSDWTDPAALILALEWRAALVVQAHAQLNDGEGDANGPQRVSNAVSDAFVASQVGEMINNLATSSLGSKERKVIEQVYILVRHWLFSNLYQGY